MSRLLIVAVFALVPTIATAQTHVDGHYRRDGTYVPPHYRTSPDGNTFNNWSTRGNVNPYTGERGTVDPYKQQSPSYGSGPSGYGNNIYGTKRRGY